MNEFPFGYEKIAPATWAYMSALLILTLFFKFNRFWSFRNLDLLLILLLSPGLIMVTRGEGALRQNRDPAASAPSVNATTPPNGATSNGQVGDPPVLNATDGVTPTEARFRRTARWGYIWLLSVAVLFLIRLLLDPLLMRKPHLEPNLMVGGLMFLVCSQCIFIGAHILQGHPQPEELAGPREAFELVRGASGDISQDLRRHGPGLAIVHLIPVFPTLFVGDAQRGSAQTAAVEVESIVIAKIMAILLQLAIVAGLVFIGKQHFADVQTGLSMAAIHLLSPYTAQFAGHVLHILPAALLVWAIAMFRRPLVAGVLIGLVAGVSYYPLFLLPLWFSFYWERGARRFGAGFACAIVAIIAVLILIVPTWREFWVQLQAMFGFWLPKVEGLLGIWQLGWDPWFRLPILVAFMGLSISFVFWPIRKTLATLIAYSAAIMVAVQFWHGHMYGGGLLMAWYMPLMLMTIFRPNLDEVTAAA
jgi:hypothetical protein